MTAAFVIAVVLLLIVAVVRARFQQATLYWERTIAGVRDVEEDIRRAKESWNSEYAAQLLGRSVHQRGFQDAITPLILTRVTIIYWVAWISVYVWGFFVLPLYVAIPWPIAYFAAKRVLKGWLPDPQSDYYRQKIIASLVSRRGRFDRSGDYVRANAAQYMVTLLRQHDECA